MCTDDVSKLKVYLDFQKIGIADVVTKTTFKISAYEIKDNK